MKLCVNCKQFEVKETISEKIASWIVNHVFPETLKDECNAARIIGYERGYIFGNKSAQELIQVQYQLTRIEEALEKKIYTNFNAKKSL